MKSPALLSSFIDQSTSCRKSGTVASLNCSNVASLYSCYKQKSHKIDYGTGVCGVRLKFGGFSAFLGSLVPPHLSLQSSSQCNGLGLCRGEQRFRLGSKYRVMRTGCSPHDSEGEQRLVCKGRNVDEMADRRNAADGKAGNIADVPGISAFQRFACKLRLPLRDRADWSRKPGTGKACHCFRPGKSAI